MSSIFMQLTFVVFIVQSGIANYMTNLIWEKELFVDVETSVLHISY